MRKAVLLFAILAASACVLSSCETSVTPIAARVDGSTIDTSTLNAVVSEVANDHDYTCAVQASEQANTGSVPAILGKGGHSYATSFVDQQLDFMIYAVALQNRLAKMHIRANALAEQAATLNLAQDLNPPANSACTVPGSVVIAQMPTVARKVVVSYFANEAALAAHDAHVPLTSAGLGAYERAHPDQTQLVCTDAILVASAAIAAKVESALASGSSFSSLAKQYSIDTSSAPNGGALGCIPAPELAPPLDTILEHLPVGGTSSAQAYQSDFVILHVDKRQAPSLAFAASQVVSTQEVTDSFQGAITTFDNEAKVSVSPAYGSWAKAPGTSSYVVAAPHVPASSLLANPAAVSP